MTTQSRTPRAFGRGGGFTSIAIVMAAVGCGTPGSAASDPSGASADLAPKLVVAPPAPAAPVVIRPRAGTVRLDRGEHPLARPELDQGRLDPEKRIANLSVFFKLSPEQLADRDALAAAQLDPKSPEYHRWLTPETYQARFGARAEDIARVSDWLARQGLEVHGASRLGSRVSFSAKVSALETAFQTEMHQYRIGNGELHFAMATAPAVPAQLAPVILGFHNTHDFFPKPISRRTNAGAFANKTDAPRYTINFPGGPDGGFQVLGPPDWAAAYDVSRLYDPGIGGQPLDGTGVTIGIVGTAAIAQSDIDAFRTRFGLPASAVTMTLVPNTGASAGGQQGAGVEAILDVEWSGGIAKGAKVNYVYVGKDDYDVDDATFYLIEQNLAPVMSESYGGCEIGNVPSDADILAINGTAANLQGITYMAAAGDSGAADCIEEGYAGLYVDLPGSFPGVTAVGGTQFPTPGWDGQGNLDSYPALEQVWNEGNDPYQEYHGQLVGVGAGGGGISSIFLRPAYQAGVAACATDGVQPTPTRTAMRQVPDVALSAASGTPGYYIECTFDNSTQDCSATGGTPFGTPIGGTSASSPSFAGFVAILNQAVGERLGNINPILYQLQSGSAGSASPFHDITSGSNEIACGAAGAGDAGGPDGGLWPDAGCGSDGLYGYVAAPGYDCASGIGSIDGYNLASAWLSAVATDTVIVPTPDHTAEGEDVTLTATIKVDGANANALTGNVVFVFESYALDGSTDLSSELGTVPVAAGTVTGGQVVLTTTVPPGLVNPGHQQVDVVAIYEGDVHHRASTSAKVPLLFAPLTFAIDPAKVSLQPLGMETFTSTGGKAPVRWFIDSDTTVSFSNNNFAASTLDENTGAFVAGPKAGYVVIEALDAFGAEAIGEITVGDPKKAPPWETTDAGVQDAGHDAVAIKDSSAPVQDADEARDAGTARDAAAAADAMGAIEPGGDGCTCELAKGNRAAHGAPSAPMAVLGSALFGLGVAARRRRARR